MGKQLIISIGREFGSGGHVIAEELSKRFDLPLFDINLLKEIAGEKNVEASRLEMYDEVPKSTLLSRTVRGYSNSPEVNVANMQFEYLLKLADEGRSFVVVGRCSESVLKDHDGLVSVFILADMETKIERIRKLGGFSRSQAITSILTHDKARKAYHNYYSVGKWGDSRNYDLCINSSRLGIEGTTDTLEAYIRERIKADNN